MVRGTLSEVLGIPMSQIRVISEHMGGGFGAKQDLYQHEYLPRCWRSGPATGRLNSPVTRRSSPAAPATR